MENKLKEWLQSAKSKGYSNNEIRKLLAERRYSEGAIKDILSSLNRSDSSKLNELETIKNIANKNIIRIIIGILVIIAISIALLSIGIRNNSIKEIGTAENVEAIAVIESVVNGNMEVRLPEIKDGKLSPSDKILNKDFQIRFVSNGAFIDRNRILAPSSVMPEERDIKLKAINELGLLEQVNDEYKNSYTTLNSISKDIFIVWKEQELVIAKGNILKIELMGDKGIALIGIGDLHREYAGVDNKTVSGKKFNIFFKNVTENYEINNHKLSLKLNDKEIAGEAPIKMKDKIVNGAVAMDDNKIQGMLVMSNGGIYFINSEMLKSAVEQG